MNNSIYEPPSSNLQTEKSPPISYLSGPLSTHKLKFLGWVSIFSASLSIPMIGIVIMNVFEPTTELYPKLNIALEIVSSIVWIYLILMFKVFINYRFEFSKANKHINIIVLITLLMTITSVIFSGTSGESGGIDMGTISLLVLIIPLGVVSFLFGKRLLTINTNFSYLRLFSWLNIIMGVCLVSIILLLLVVPLGIVYDIVLALIFFTASKDFKEAKRVSLVI